MKLVHRNPANSGCVELCGMFCYQSFIFKLIRTIWKTLVVSSAPHYKATAGHERADYHRGAVLHPIKYSVIMELNGNPNTLFYLPRKWIARLKQLNTFAKQSCWKILEKHPHPRLLMFTDRYCVADGFEHNLLVILFSSDSLYPRMWETGPSAHLAHAN